MKNKHLFLLSSLLSLPSLAQVEKIEWINSGEILESAIELENSDADTDEILDLYAKIPNNDTNFFLMQTRMTTSLLDMERYEDMIAECWRGIEAESEYTYLLYNRIGLAHFRNGDIDKAIEVLKGAIAIYPDYHLYYYNIGIFLEKQDKYQEAIAYYKETINVSPKFPAAHLRLGILAMEEGKYTEALLACNTYLLFEQVGEEANYILRLMDKMVSQAPDLSNKRNLKFSDEGDNFEDIELILQNRVALSKKYKVKPKYNLPVHKQSHVLFEKLEYDASDKGFFMQTYVPMYKKLFEKGYFQGFAHGIIQSSESDKHKKGVQKNIPAIKEFYTWFFEEIETTWQMVDIDLGDGVKSYKRWYDSEQKLEAIGNEKSVDGTRKLRYLWDDMKLLSEGEIDDEDNRIGVWNWYHKNGRLNQYRDYLDGKPNGPSNIYYDNGNLKDSSIYVNGVLQGESIEYYENGAVSVTSNLLDGKLDGEAIYYHPVGGMSYKVFYTAGKLNGSYTQYHENGTIASERNFIDGKLDGSYKTYNTEGTLVYESNYIEGDMEGPWKRYYANGELHKTGVSKEGNPIGEFFEYYQGGIISEKYSMDEKGKITGTTLSYNREGLLSEEMEYLKGNLNAYKQFDKSGGIIAEGKLKRGKLKFESYRVDGSKRSDGQYVKKDRTGIWNFYDNYGVLSSKENYAKGTIEGEKEVYFADGSLFKKMKYADGQIEGYYEEYYNTGQLEQHGHYKAGELDGVWEGYYLNGAREYRYFYMNGERHGDQYNYAVDGKLATVESFERGSYLNSAYFDTLGNEYASLGLDYGTGEIDNKHMYFDAKVSHQSFLNGYRNGPAVWYHHNGNVRIQASYTKDRRTGDWIWYDENGLVKTRGSYTNGDKHGKWENFFSDDTKLRSVEFYEYGVLQGASKRFDKETGKVTFERFYIDGNKNGPAPLNSKNGTLKYTRHYEFGTLVAYSALNEAGELIKEEPLTGGTGSINAFYPNGKPSMEVHYLEGVLHGKYVEYFENGNIEDDTQMYYGDNHGLAKYYYENGQMKSFYTYIHGFLQGEYKRYHSNGNLKEEGIYLNHEKNGIIKKYDESGMLIRTEEYFNESLIKVN